MPAMDFGVRIAMVLLVVLLVLTVVLYHVWLDRRYQRPPTTSATRAPDDDATKADKTDRDVRTRR